MTDNEQKINALVARLERHQRALGLSDSLFAARYQRHIGSTKTWRDRLIGGKREQFNPQKWLPRLTAFVAEIDGGSVLADYFERLPIADYGAKLYEVLQGRTTDRRCGVLLGTYGVGKTVTLRRLASEHPNEAVYVRANETWKESRMQIALGLANALGCTVEPGAAATFRRVLEHLKASEITVLIDEAHEGGVLLFKLVKTCIDESRTKFILGSYPTAWNRLCNGSTDAASEAQQLLGRTVKPIWTRWTAGVSNADVAAYLESATGLNGECRVLAEKVLAQVRRGGNLRVLADAVELARIVRAEDGGELTPEAIAAAVSELCPVEGSTK